MRENSSAPIKVMGLERSENVREGFDAVSVFNFGRAELHCLQVPAVSSVPDERVTVIVVAQRAKSRPHEKKSRERRE